jgi:hypothetical protein
MYGLIYILKYRPQIKFCDKFKRVTNVLRSYNVVRHHPEMEEIYVGGY